MSSWCGSLTDRNTCHHDSFWPGRPPWQPLASQGSGGRGCREACDVGEGQVLSPVKMVSTVEKAEPSSALSLLCLFRYKPSCEVGPFHENSSRLRAHGIQRCLHLPYVSPAGFRFCGRARPRSCMDRASHSQHETALVPRAS